MIPLVLLLLASTPADAFLGPVLTRSKARLRELDCERMTDDLAATRYPGRVRVSQSRAADPDRTVVVCTERLLVGLRAAADEAVLRELAGTVSRVASLTAPFHAELDGRTWMVEAYTPNAQVGDKVRFALKNEMVADGLRVSDRLPVLAVGEQDILTRFAPLDAYPAACRRYAASGSVGPNDVLISVVTLDPRETLLHAGMCVDGAFWWLP